MTDNLNIQIQYLLDIPISEYKRKILTGDFNLPDFSDKCPICRARDCAVFLGFYYRNTENTIRKELILDVPIARYECQRVYPVPAGSHRTFSLLPDPLIPYLRRDIETVHMINRVYIQNERSLTETAGELTIQFGLGEDKYFSTASVWMYVRLFETAQTRYKARDGQRPLEDLSFDELQKEVRRFPGFLFGTPSQGQSGRTGRGAHGTLPVVKKTRHPKRKSGHSRGRFPENHTTLIGESRFFHYFAPSHLVRRLL